MEEITTGRDYPNSVVGNMRKILKKEWEPDDYGSL